MNKCECTSPGFCNRHGIKKNSRMQYLCSHSPKHFAMWERKANERNEILSRPYPPLVLQVVAFVRSMSLWAVSGFRFADHLPRQKKCDSCEARAGLLCRPCGCFLWLKTRMPHEACIAGKWNAEPIKIDPPSGKVTGDTPNIIQIASSIPRKGGCGCAKSKT